MTLAITGLVLRRRLRSAGLLAVGIALEGLLYLALTSVISRARPPVGQLERLLYYDSFPSGHAAGSVVVYVGLALVVTRGARDPRLRRAAWTVAVVVPLFVGFSRIARGMHYTSDVLAGYCLGFGCLLVAATVVRVTVVATGRRKARQGHRGAHER